MIVEVRPLPNEKWHGKKGEESFTRPKKISALVDGDSMTYATGLTEEEVVKFSAIFKNDLGNQYDPDEPHPFWDSPLGVVKLENNTQLFDTKENINKIRVKLMKASKYVANTFKEWEQGKWPEATHYIYDESEEIEATASKIVIKQEAILKQSKLSTSRKQQIILIATGKDLKGQSDDFVTVAMSDIIDKDPEQALRYIQQDKTEVANHALVIESIQKNVLRKVGHKIMYMDSVLGTDELDVARYLMEEDNNELKIRLMKAVSE
jgi:hypothetical protein